MHQEKLEESMTVSSKNLDKMKKEKDMLLKSIEIEEKRIQCLREDIENKSKDL